MRAAALQPDDKSLQLRLDAARNAWQREIGTRARRWMDPFEAPGDAIGDGADGRERIVEVDHARADGVRRLRVSLTPVEPEDAPAEGMLLGSVLDVTESHWHEAYAAAVIDNAVEAIITTDESGRIESFNRAASSMFGYSQEEAMGMSVASIMPEPYRSHHGEYLARYLNTGDLFGEIGFIGDAPRTADVRAITDVSVLRYDLERIRKDLKYFPGIVAKLNFNISAVLGARLAEQMEMQETR